MRARAIAPKPSVCESATCRMAYCKRRFSIKVPRDLFQAAGHALRDILERVTNRSKHLTIQHLKYALASPRIQGNFHVKLPVTSKSKYAVIFVANRIEIPEIVLLRNTGRDEIAPKPSVCESATCTVPGRHRLSLS